MTDRLHYYYTTTFLLVTSVLISLKMYGGRPIEVIINLKLEKIFLSVLDARRIPKFMAGIHR